MKLFALSYILFSILFNTACNKPKKPEGKTAASVRLGIDLSNPSQQVIKNIFSDVNLWDFRGDWTTKANGKPANYFSENFPFVKHIQFMTATGGNATRDLLINPTDINNLKDYKFSEIISALRNVVKQGLKPMIKTGSVPFKYSKNPYVGSFGVNVRPPANYDMYYDYIKALADECIAIFGIGEVTTWSWGVLTEYENRDWFAVEGDDPEATKIAYFKLYDYTVAALQASIGAANLKVGAHSMTTIKGLWNEFEFIDHVAKGTNYKTGKTGTQINFLCSSFYEKTPGIIAENAQSGSEVIQALRYRAEQNGLTDLEYGIDEGRILSGPAEDGRDLTSRVVGFTFQAASDARMFKNMTDVNADWVATWCLLTDGMWGGIPPIGTHIASLGYKMAGNNRLDLKVSGRAANNGNEVNGIAACNKMTGVIQLMVYNYNADMNASSAEKPVIIIDNINPATGNTVTVKQWIVDDTHANFWPTWWKDMHIHGLTKESYNWSMYSIDLPQNLLKPSDKDFWNTKEASYKMLSQLESKTSSVNVKNNTLTLNPMLEHHAVVFYEITNVK